MAKIERKKLFKKYEEEFQSIDFRGLYEHQYLNNFSRGAFTIYSPV